MAMLDDIFLDELVDDPEPMLVEEPEAVEDNRDADEQPPLNPSAPSEDAVRVAPKKSGIKRQYVLLNPQKVTGPRGIQCIEKYFKNVKLKGKGHELSDLNTVMSHLEHWANRMYPRSKFDDVLKRLEVLGHKRPVMTQIKKIRLGMIQEPEQDSNLVLSDTEAPTQPRTADDIFDELLASQPSQHTTASVKEISEAQKERMLRNRRIAEEKRQARLAAEAERKKREEANAQTLQGIEFQTALLETQGSERETILSRGVVARKDEVVTQEAVSESQEVVSKSQEVVSESQEVIIKSQEAVSESQQVVSENEEIVSESQEVISKSQEVVSKSEDIVSKGQEVVSKSQEVVSKGQEVVRESQDLFDASIFEGFDKWKMSENLDEAKGLDETEESSQKSNETNIFKTAS